MNLPSAVRAFRARPIAALAVVFAITTMGNALLMGCGGKAQENAGEPSTGTPPAADGAAPGGAPAAGDVSIAAGQKVYTERCVLCHGASGKGDGVGAAGLDPKPRDHTDGTYMNAQTDESLLSVIRDGKGNMPAWGNILSDAEQTSVLMYVRSLAVPPYQGAH